MARPRQVSDQDILDAARACFIEHGPSVSTSLIAGELGVSQAALFKRFGTKEELMLAALMPVTVPEWVTMVQRGPGPDPIPEQLQRIATAVADFFAELTPCMSTLRASGIDVAALMARSDVPPPLRGVQALSQWLSVAMEQGRVRVTNPTTLAMMIIGSLHGRAFLVHVLGVPELGGDTYAHDLVDTLWCGIAPPEVG